MNQPSDPLIPSPQPGPPVNIAPQTVNSQQTDPLAPAEAEQVVNPYGAPTADPQSNLRSLGMGDEVDTSVLIALYGTRGWVMFFSILLFVFIGFGSLALLFSLMSPFMSKMGLLIQFVILGLYAFAAAKLYQYGTGIKRLMVQPTQEKLAETLDKQRVFWKFLGIMTIIGIVLMILAFFLALSAVAKAKHGNFGV